MEISIHASAREATLHTMSSMVSDCDFNPRLREGGDFKQFEGTKEYDDFNPRLREGGDIIRMISRRNSLDFNPRLREGGDRIDY